MNRFEAPETSSFTCHSISIHEILKFQKKNLVRLLESGPKITLKAKCEVFHLICYVAKDPRCMELITANTHLVDRIAMAIDHEESDVAKVALKTAQILAVSRNGIKVSSLILLFFLYGNIMFYF